MDLLKTYRDEKASHNLIELPDDFFDQARVELDRLNGPIETEIESVLMQQELKSSIRALNALSDLRINKVLKGAIADAYRKTPEHALDKMLPREKKLYQAVVDEIKEVKAA